MPEPEIGSSRALLLRARAGLILNQAIYAATKLGIADHLAAGLTSVTDLAAAAKVNESALHRVLCLLASEGIFEEISPGEFRNNGVSELLQTGVPGSLRAGFLFWGSEFFYASLGEILYSVQTGEPSRTKLSGMDGFAYLRQNPDAACTFDDAMTATVEQLSPAIAASYNFGAWESLMDVGGGNGILLANILRAHPKLRGVLADQEHVLHRARQKHFLGGELEARVSQTPCDFFREVPPGCRAYMMARVIHDWTDEQATVILSNCRRAIPPDGVLLLVEQALGEMNQPSEGRFTDVVMLVLTGGRERTVEEYRALLGKSGFRLNDVLKTRSAYAIFEAHPV
jgi:hypothetical protein